MTVVYLRSSLAGPKCIYYLRAMQLQLHRTDRTDTSTIGELAVDGKFQCYILEDVDRHLTSDTLQNKVHGKTAIPAGTYEIAVTFSTRFNKPLPLLLNVPGFEGIRIHPGNTSADTEGCLLPGTTKGPDKVLNSRIAFDKLFTVIRNGLKVGKVFITID